MAWLHFLQLHLGGNRYQVCVADHKSPEIGSFPWVVLSARHVLMSIASATKRTLPSQMPAWMPPECRLRAPYIEG